MNIAKMAMTYLGPVVANKAASMLGINNSVATKLISAALPSILAALVGKASSGSGASALLNMIKSPNVGSPSGLEAILDGPGAADVASTGSNMLTELLGGNAVGALSGALGKYGGAGEAETNSLLGLVGPVALGSLQEQVNDQGLDADGLASFLSGQKENIARAVPTDFAPMLGSTGLLDGIKMPEMAGMAEAAAGYAPEMSAPEMPKSGGMMKWVIGAVVLLGLAWYFLTGNSAPEMTDVTGGVDMSVGDVNVGDQFGSAMDTLKSTVGGITDADSAQAALPQLEGVNAQLDEITGLAGQLPEAAKAPFAGIVSTAMATIQPMIDSAIEASGAGAILQPIVDSMMEKLAGLAG